MTFTAWHFLVSLYTGHCQTLTWYHCSADWYTSGIANGVCYARSISYTKEISFRYTRQAESSCSHVNDLFTFLTYHSMERWNATADTKVYKHKRPATAVRCSFALDLAGRSAPTALLMNNTHLLGTPLTSAKSLSKCSLPAPTAV